jgi:hypothetical protein
MLPTKLKQKILVSMSGRQNPTLVDQAVSDLGVALPEDALEFYRLFPGPMGTDTMGYQLLDMVNDNPSVKSITQVMRKKFNLPAEWLAISDLLAGGLLIFNTKTNEVYDVDFEGTLERVLGGRASPTWTTFTELLEVFFSEFDETSKADAMPT